MAAVTTTTSTTGRKCVRKRTLNVCVGAVWGLALVLAAHADDAVQARGGAFALESWPLADGIVEQRTDQLYDKVAATAREPAVAK